MSREQQIQELTEALASLASGVVLSDAVDSESSVNDGVAATPKAVKTAYDRASTAITNAATAITNAATAKSTADNALSVADSKQNALDYTPVKSVNGVEADAAGNVALKSVITETWVSGASWYRKWSDGWIEQGGRLTTTTNRQTITLHQAFKNTNYTVLHTLRNATASGALQPFTESVQSMTTTSFTLYCDSATLARMWYACGY